MPGMDKTGPMAAGPMTGGGWGRCNPANTGEGAPVVAGLGRRRGFGGPPGGGFGRRRGRFRAWWQATALGIDEPMEPAAEVDKLQAAADSLKKTLDRLNSRIEQLRGKDKEAEQQ